MADRRGAHIPSRDQQVARVTMTPLADSKHCGFSVNQPNRDTAEEERGLKSWSSGRNPRRNACPKPKEYVTSLEYPVRLHTHM